MREKYILRVGEVGSDPDAWVIGIYFTRSEAKGKKGTLSIGGPGRFRDRMDEVLRDFFGIEDGLEDDVVEERQKDRERKRLVFDVEPLTFRAFRHGVRDMVRVGISAVHVRSTGRLMR